jgi:hypothetical protein
MCTYDMDTQAFWSEVLFLHGEHALHFKLGVVDATKERFVSILSLHQSHLPLPLTPPPRPLNLKRLPKHLLLIRCTWH